ncbi:MAG: DtxR family transcriptional regulator [Fibrobacter sp.]|nr:DtxR family transcriptional regulator [Fibrobacter sp.]
MSSSSLTPTLEDYLEAIYQISLFNKVARSMEIADKLNVKRSSVTVALKSLADKGLINYQARSYITLTENGMNAARCVDRKHRILSDLFVTLFKMPLEEADKAACGMEHGMTSEVCKKLSALMGVLRKDTETCTKLGKEIEEYEKISKCESGISSIKTDTNDNADNAGLCDLNALKPGEHGIIEKILGSGTLKKRLQEMGVTHGQEIFVVRAAPLDDPIEIRIRKFYLSLRREEACLIIVRKT